MSLPYLPGLGRHAWLLLALVLLAPVARAAADDDLRHTLFGAADTALTEANEVKASLLAPQSYAEGAESYRRAESTLASGGGIESIRRNLGDAATAFGAAAQAARLARQTFPGALDAREDAANAEAARYAEDDWNAAERSLGEAALRLERGRESSAGRLAEQAEARYREAELNAIQGNYLNETRSLLEIADDLRASRYAPISFERAQALLEEAEQTLIDDRYDTDRPRNLAQVAEHNAHHAIYVSRLQRRIRDRDTTLEEILLDWESGIRSLADQVDTPVYFDAGHEEAIERLYQAIATLQADISFLEQGIADRDARIASLEMEVGGQSQSLKRVNDALAKRERQGARFARVEALFGADQAAVLRQGDSVILRMIGLNFSSGSAALVDAHRGLLEKVRRALGEFPQANIVVEGHTDAFGSDASNQTLSQARAGAVLDYLLSNSPVSPADITALGYGESRPVANNETPEGRQRNRRIDVVIYPKE